MLVYLEFEDYYEKNIEYPMIVLFTSNGYRLGYVGVPKNNSYYGLDMSNEKVEELIVHGGVTYSEQGLNMKNCINSKNCLHDLGYYDSYWWIGFDCIHYFDNIDLNSIKRYFPNENYNNPFFLFESNYKQKNDFVDLNSAIDQVFKLATQIYWKGIKNYE